MAGHITIAVDVMGGDYGPVATIEGTAIAHREISKKHDSVSFLLFGNKSSIQTELEKYPRLAKQVTIIHTDDVVLSDEKPSAALRNRKKSSMALSIQAVKSGEADCVISAGNTGALMAMAKLILRPQSVVQRPAIGSVFPTMANPTLMMDLGANVNCDGQSLAQFAVLGAVYAKAIMKVENPKVGILNIGSEDTKGHEDVRDAAAILSEAKDFPGQYYGFVEGNDIAQGTVDVIVTDGFTGNVALKTAEGVGKMSQGFIKDAFRSSLLAKFGYLFCYFALQKVKKRLDPRDYNGGLFLGLQGLCIKSHGGMDAYGFSKALEVGAQMVRNDYIKLVSEEIEKLMAQTEKEAQDKDTVVKEVRG